MVPLDGALVDATKIVLAVAFSVTLLFTLGYLLTAKWRHDPVGWVVAGDRTALTLILALIGLQSFWTFSLSTADLFLWFEDALLSVTALVSLVGLGFMLWLRRSKPRP